METRITPPELIDTEGLVQDRPTQTAYYGTPMHISITEIAYASGMLIGGLLLGLFGNYQKPSPKWIFHICSLLCNNGAFGSVLQRCANSSFSGEN